MSLPESSPDPNQSTRPQTLDYETPKDDDAIHSDRPPYLRPPGCFLFALLIATEFVLLLVLAWLYDMHWRR